MRWLLSVFLAVAAVSPEYAGAAESGGSDSQPMSAGESSIPSRTRLAIPAIANELALLFSLQDGAAQGEQDSLSALKHLLLDAGPRVATFVRSANEEEIRFIAPFVVAYVLSGGDPHTATALSQSTVLDHRYRQVLEASALFMQGDMAAAKIFAEVDLDQFPARMRGRLALVMALLEREDTSLKQQHLATAMAAMPGSLVEESAVRRSALSFAEAGDERNFWERLGRYQRRFPHSLFARAFWGEVSAALVKWAAKEPSFTLDGLDLVWGGMTTPIRRTLYLELARDAAALNERRVTEFAAARVQRLAAEGGAEDQLARLYMSIYKIASPAGDDALRELKSLRRDLLGEQEQALLTAALALNAQINRPLPMVQTKDGLPPEDEPLSKQAQVTLADADKLMTEIAQ